MSLEDLSNAVGLSLEDRELLARLLADEGVELSTEENRIPRRGAAEAPLSYAQERLWVLDRLNPGTSALNIAAAFGLRGRFESAVARRAFSEVVRRHEVLRTRFVARSGVPVQVVEPPGPVAFPRIDLLHLDPEQRVSERDRIAERFAAISFDLERGPLLALAVAAIAPDDHALYLNLHHTVTDGWSMGIFLREFTELYAAFALGKPSPLPELPIQVGDHAAWEREQLGGSEVAASIDWWRTELSGLAPLELPSDRPRPAVATSHGAEVRSLLPRSLADRMAALAREEGASPFMVLLAGLGLVLGRLAGQDDFAIGAPISGRGRPELEGLIGCFLNSLALRVDLSGNPSGRELVRRVGERARGVFAHQDLPFEKLLAELNPARDLSRTPIFQVFLNMLNLPEAKGELPGLNIAPLGSGAVESKFDFTLYAEEQVDGLGCRLVYNTDLFDAPRMRELLAQLETALTQLLAAPERPIAQISLATDGARAILPDPTAPLDESWIGSVVELFDAQAAAGPERLAVIDALGRWTYAELAEASARVASRLRQAGIGRGDRVAILAQRRASLVPAVLGTLRAGGAFTMLDPAYPAERLLAMIRLAEPKGWISFRSGEGSTAALPDLESWLGTLPPAARIEIPLGGPAQLFASLPPAAEEPAVPVGPDDIAYVAFTSGSTGQPKGILGRHGPLSHFLPWQCERFGVGRDDVFTMLSGLAHDPLQRDLFTPLFLGAALAVPDAADFGAPGRLAAWMAERGVTSAHLTPAMAQLVTEGARIEVPTLRRVLLVGDALTRLDVARLKKLAPNVVCVNLFGSTETQRAVSFHEVGPEEIAGVLQGGASGKQVLPLGRGMKDVQLLVLDGAGRLAGLGEVGEIATRSPHLAAGYLGDPELTAARFLANPFLADAATRSRNDRLYKTGDLGRYRFDGEVEYVARADAQIKIRGFRIEPAEIEAALGTHPAVREGIVIARSDGGGEKRLVGYVVGHENAAAFFDGDWMAELAAHLRARIPEYMVPALWKRLDRLPVTPNGKVDRKVLPPPEAVRVEGFVAPRSDAERTVAEVFREVLGVERVGANDRFFALGGHSLALVRASALLSERFGREIPLLDLFRHPDVASLAAHLAGEGDDGAGELSTERAAALDAGRDRRRQQLARRRGGGDE